MEGREEREGMGEERGWEVRGRKGWGGERAGSPPKLKLAPRTIFLAPALSKSE